MFDPGDILKSCFNKCLRFNHCPSYLAHIVVILEADKMRVDQCVSLGAHAHNSTETTTNDGSDSTRRPLITQFYHRSIEPRAPDHRWPVVNAVTRS